MKTNYTVIRILGIVLLFFISLSWADAAPPGANIKLNVKCGNQKAAVGTQVCLFLINPSTGEPLHPLCYCSIIGCHESTDVICGTVGNGGSVSWSGKPAGIYQVIFGITCTSQQLCQNSSDCIALLSTPTGIITVNASNGGNVNQTVQMCPARADMLAEDAGTDHLSVYPNPATDRATLDVSSYEGKTQLQVVNALGQQVFNKSITLNGEEIYSIDVASFAKGIYKVILINDADVSTGTLIKE